MEKQMIRQLPLPRAFIRRCRQSLSQPKVTDSSGERLTGGELLSRSLALGRVLRRDVLAAAEKMVGLLLPPSIGGVLANAALPLFGRIPVNLNYTVSADVMNSCIAQCEIRHVLTSRKVMERLKVELKAELVFMEDLPQKVTRVDKLAAAIGTYVLPAFALERMLGLHRVSVDDLLTVIFTSGSTGDPKGVMLTHRNVASNVESVDQIVHLQPSDVVLGVLPFFHSYGYTITLWTVLSLVPQGVYHYSPLDSRQVGELCEKYGVTIMTTTPTFLRSYARRCTPQQFAKLDVIFTSAEKLPAELSLAFKEKFGVQPCEAYGATELSPLATANVPEHRSTGGDRKGAKEGTVGRPVPGVIAKVVDPDTWADLGIDQPGMLLIKGPNVMKGYLHKPDLSAEVIRDGWYITGDIAAIDSDGFVKITDRRSRFSKIGGEMVPHLKIEESLAKILGNTEELTAVVTALPDEKKGERLIVIHKATEKSPDQICRELSEAGLPNIWIPARDSFLQVDEIPALGSGKLDLKAIKLIALKHFGSLSK